MRNKVVTFLCVICLFTLIGCGNKVEKQEVSTKPEVTASKEEAEEQSNLDMLPEKLQKVISGEETFMDVEQNMTYTFTTYTMITSEGDTVEVYWGNYIVADVDSDGENELIVRVNSEKNPESVDESVRVLDLQGDTIYCYTYPYRGLLNVYKDGVMEGSSGAQDNIFFTAKYDGMKKEEIRVAKSISTYENETVGVEYYINENKVSETEYYDYIKIFSIENSLKWSETSLS